ncbi:hypothetical protein [Clostridium kluyveri]|uniref:Uncharacterized protein n=1 Tax=Clostridium kluyveri TaxID=1534 RepID=A0A1L5FBJ6_CLOKL|nr:hypothetical protein [Clostridium kluyveri]APM40190.1 hypothetical protein BS101_16300 [Clostridium kluyveri]
MNKKVKFLSSTLSALLLTSGIALTNVQAQGTEANYSTKSISTVNSVQSADFTSYCYLSDSQVNQIYTFLHSTDGHGFVDFLVNNNITSRTVANTIGPSLFIFGVGTILIRANEGNGVIFLRSSQNSSEFTVVPNNNEDFNFDTYCALSSEYVSEILDYINTSHPTNSYQLADFMMLNDIISNSSRANNVAAAILGNTARFEADDMGDGILILQSITSSTKYVATPAF